MTPITSLGLVDTEYSACSVEFAPGSSHSGVLACGTYQLLDPKTGEKVVPLAPGETRNEEAEVSDEAKKRVGRLYLFQVEGGKEGKMVMKEMDRHEAPAILDLKWMKDSEGKDILLQAGADGSLTSYTLDSPYKVTKMYTYQPEETDGPLALALDVSTRAPCAMSEERPRFIVSSSDGTLAEWGLGGVEGGMERMGRWKAHDFEAWTVAYDGWNTNIVYSGGDDACFRGWDRRMVGSEEDVDTLATPTFTNRTYDEYIRLWDKRAIRRPLQELSLGGGVWRLRWHPERPTALIAACMYGGCRVLEATEDLTSLQVVGTFEEHASMAYGIDWGFGLGAKSKDIVASCSFYDHVMHAWNP